MRRCTDPPRFFPPADHPPERRDFAGFDTKARGQGKEEMRSRAVHGLRRMAPAGGTPGQPPVDPPHRPASTITTRQKRPAGAPHQTSGCRATRPSAAPISLDCSRRQTVHPSAGTSPRSTPRPEARAKKECGHGPFMPSTGARPAGMTTGTATRLTGGSAPPNSLDHRRQAGRPPGRTLAGPRHAKRPAAGQPGAALHRSASIVPTGRPSTRAPGLRRAPCQDQRSGQRRNAVTGRFPTFFGVDNLHPCR